MSATPKKLFGLGRKSIAKRADQEELAPKQVPSSDQTGRTRQPWDMSSVQQSSSSSGAPPPAPAIIGSTSTISTSSAPSPRVSRSFPPLAPSATTSSTSTSATNNKASVNNNNNTSINSSINNSKRSSNVKAQNIATSAGTTRLNRILHQPSTDRVSYVPDDNDYDAMQDTKYTPRNSMSRQSIEKVQDPSNETEVGRYVANYVIPALRVDSRSIGGHLTESVSLVPSSIPTTSTVQECLLSMKCRAFEASGGERISSSALEDPKSYAKHKRSLGFAGVKARNKIRYVFLVRSTNRPLLRKEKANRSGQKKHTSADDDESSYQGIYDDDDDDDDDNHRGPVDLDGEDKPEDELLIDTTEEISSFPVLVCMALHSDGTNPDVRKLISLDQLSTVQNVSTANVVQLVFAGGDAVVVDFTDAAAASSMRKERFVWSLLQIHAMLCTSVVERNSLGNAASARSKDRLLQPLQVRNLDRAELQYVAQVNGFLRDSPALCALLDRQRDIGKSEEETHATEDKDLAYDILMGNYTTRVALFQSVEERADAEAVLNAIAAEPEEEAGTAVERLSELLQERMRDLESETCRRLIAWEDEKHYSLTGQSAFDMNSAGRDTTVDSLSLSALFNTLDLLDKELGDMENWLEERASVIKPLTDDCHDIEEENRQLEQQWNSYEILKAELQRLLQGVDVPRDLASVLMNPASALVYDAMGAINVEASEAGVDKIHHAGTALKQAMDNAKAAGGVHLLAVSERVESLSKTSNQFCTALAQIIVTVMEQFKTEVVAGSDHGKVSKSDTNSMIAKKIRDTQRKFHSALLGYMKLIEVLALLKPQLLPAIRDAYSEMVAEGILMKKRMKGYFQALPGKNMAYLNAVSHDLKDYSPVGEPHFEKTVNAIDIGAALTELLPVIAREAYFTAALFGLSSKSLDGREKKRNFESAKRSVDHSTQYFRYYIQRTCGIHDDQTDPTQPSTRTMRSDPMLALVASIYLNEAMEQYIDREKKGGDQSLSLAYVRATILGLRKKVDKQWVGWVDEQIEWIRSNPGVPATGKRAGIFMSFSRFPAYLDHILLCCREGKSETYTPDFVNIQVVSYYLQKMSNALLDSLRTCAERETTDQQYAANVMRMENAYFFTQKIKERGPEISALFQKQIAKASTVCKQSTDAYLGWMIKREFKALHALFSQVSRIRRDVGDKDVPIHVSRSTFVKTLQKESNREVMKEKIGIMYGRMEKHLSEDGGLLPIAWKALVKVLYEWFGRWEKLSSQCYKHILEPSAVDVVRLAKQAGAGSGGSKPGPPTVADPGKVAKSPPTTRPKAVADQGQLSTRKPSQRGPAK